ncbi:tRNA pseudouridine(38-40) synthase TruA, partial [Nocardioides sp.]|uniref:tRNA pseudouridine(38-40) synthase TruA n=1 Tax=Nocardioides sp. TaxID=35761 RepID=UPI002735279B
VRIRIDLAYDGTDFKGWATQPGLRTVQGSLEPALGTALRTDPVRVTCAGRTDTGVHARGQVVHLDVPAGVVEASAGRSQDPPMEALRRRLNGILPPDVRVRRAVEAPDGFNARFSALWRRYAYRIADDPAAYDPLVRSHVLHWPRSLDTDAMNEAAGLLLGEHDFAAFCRKREGATTIRTLIDLHWERDRAGRAVATVRADAFCHTMVRALVGCLIAVGEGRRPAEWARGVLAAGVRDPGVTVVQPQGLTLEEVAYPADDELAAQAVMTRRVRT